MVNRWFLVSVMLLASLLVVGCGIPKEDYEAVVAERDAVLAERDAAQAQVASLQNNLTAAESQINTLEGDLAEVQSQVDTLQSKVISLQGQLSSAQRDYDTLKQKVDRAMLYGEILETYYFVPYAEMTTEEMLELSSMVDKTGNAELKQKYTAWLDSTTEKQAEERGMDFFFAVWDELWAALGFGGI